ncbi:MAG: hypothetical protein J2P15_16415 [Micromonosporaceae bacterium]|nr:hypothetical protein [Micromonosporaceae bacterium]
MTAMVLAETAVDPVNPLAGPAHALIAAFLAEGVGDPLSQLDTALAGDATRCSRSRSTNGSAPPPIWYAPLPCGPGKPQTTAGQLVIAATGPAIAHRRLSR